MSEDHEKITSFVAPPLEELDRLLDGYNFETFIAQGGMGAVYLARQTSLDRQVAVKVLPREFGEDEEFRESFQSEAKLMAKLNHPNLVGIYDFGDIDGMLYIIMEFVKGKSLHHSAHGKAIAEKTAVDIISAVCAGLDHAHEAGTLHRDIKPANILLGKGAVPKIGDFGLARANGVTESGVIYGTPGYSAPEVLAAPDKVDNRTDIFAVGVMFYELLAGKMPSESGYVPVTNFVEADARFDKIIQKAIHPNIKMRYRSAKDFSEDINDVIKNPTAASKLLVAGSGNSKGAAIKVGGGSSSGSGSSDRPVPVAVTHSVPPDSKLVRNMVIIFLLLGAIFAVLELTKVRDKEVAEAQAINDAEIARKQKEKADLQATIDAEKIAAAKEKAVANGSNKTSSTHTGSYNPRPPVAKLTPLEKLDKVKELLGNGERPMAMMPETIFMRDQDSRIIMYIDEKMTWDEADAWTRAYGGYITVCKSKSEVTVLMNKVPDDADGVWLGAGSSGDKGWSWVDDTPWTESLKLKPTYNRAFAKFSKSGEVGKADGKKKLNFFIEWRADGSNPADLEYRLLRASDTLTDINPIYPPGTITAGARNYCIIKSSVTYDQASELAIASGGHLIAITNDEEKFNVEGIIAQDCESGDTFWTAAEKENNIWGWQTGEKWLNLTWAPSHPQSGNRVVITAGQELKIKDVSARTYADGFIIEWSKDKSRVKVANIGDGKSNLNGGLAALKKKAKLLVKKQRAATEKKHAYNVQKLWKDLETYMRGLPVNQRANEAVVIDQIVAMVKDKERIPKNLKGEGPSERSRDYTSYAVEKQARIELEHNKQMELLRTGYKNQLERLMKEMAKKGQTSAVKSIKEEARKIGNDAEAFESYIE